MCLGVIFFKQKNPINVICLLPVQLYPKNFTVPHYAFLPNQLSIPTYRNRQFSNYSIPTVPVFLPIVHFHPMRTL